MERRGREMEKGKEKEKVRNNKEERGNRYEKGRGLLGLESKLAEINFI